MLSNISENKIWNFFRKHWLKFLFVGVLAKPLYYLVLVIYVFTIQEAIRTIKDESIVKNTPYLGREIKIAPIAVLAKMKDYGGWTDKYLYIYAGQPKITPHNKPEWTVSLSDYVNLKVVEVKRQSGNFTGDGADIICILKNVKDPNQIVSESCEELGFVDELTELYYEASLDFKKYGSMYLAVARQFGTAFPFKPIFKVNSFHVYKLNSIQELLSLLLYNIGELNSYSYIIGRTLPFRMKNRENFDEKSISLLIETDDFSGLRTSKLFNYEKFNNYLLENEAPEDVSKWIIEKYPNSPQNRWALHIASSFFQRMILKQDKMEDYDAQNSLALYDEVVKCMDKYFKEKESSQFHFNKLKNKFLESKSRLESYREIENKAQKYSLRKFIYSSHGCDIFSPPEYLK